MVEQRFNFRILLFKILQKWTCIAIALGTAMLPQNQILNYSTNYKIRSTKSVLMLWHYFFIDIPVSLKEKKSKQANCILYISLWPYVVELNTLPPCTSNKIKQWQPILLLLVHNWSQYGSHGWLCGYKSRDTWTVCYERLFSNKDLTE